MSWPTWSATTTPIPTAVAASVQPTLLPTTLNSAPTVMAPMGYSQEQWAQAQQQNWQQWAQWQQQYQQWHQQYGAEYQKSLSAMQGSLPPSVHVQPPAVHVQPPLPALTTAVPPLPMDNKPPLPPDEPPTHQQSNTNTSVSSYSSMPPGYSTTGPPPLAQPLGAQSGVQSMYQNTQLHSWQNQTAAQKRPHPQETDYDAPKRAMVDKPPTNQWNQQKPPHNQWQASNQNFSQPPPSAQTQQMQPAAQPAKGNVEELSDAEKKFDKEFAAWEAQFNRWKEQNANHPDKTQYKEYEKKWESWRNSLLERREQMRRKRVALCNQATQKQQNVTQPVSANQEPSNSGASQPQPGAKSSILGDFPIDSPQANELFNKPPPNQNNEPLTFKGKSELDGTSNSGDGFLTSGVTSGGIPGLDLVKDDAKEDLPDRSEDANVTEVKEETPQSSKGPDLEAISKGINSILCDQKLLSMLSMVSQNPPVVPTTTDTTSSNLVQDFGLPPPNFQPFSTNKFNAPPPMYGEYANQNKSNRDDGYLQQHDLPNRFNAPPPDIRNNRSPFVAPGEIFSKPSSDNFSKGHGDNLNQEVFPNIRPSDAFVRGTGDHFSRNSRDNFQKTTGNFGENFDQFADNFRSNRNDKFNNQGDMGGNAFNNNRNNFGNRDSFDRSNSFGKNNDDDEDYDNYNEEDDYDKYNDMFKDDDEDDLYQNDNDYQRHGHSRGNQNQQGSQQIRQLINPSQQPPKIPSLLDIPLVTPMILQEEVEPLPIDEPIFEPVSVIDYEHRSKLTQDDVVCVVPNNMFDYNHKPVNCIQHAERPAWLAEAIKFIREFDPDVVRYERKPASFVQRFPDNVRENDKFANFEPRTGTRSHDKDDFYRGRESRIRDRGFRDDHFKDRSRSDGYKNTNNTRRRLDRFDNEEKMSRVSTKEFDDLSDTEMDFEQNEQVRHQHEFETRNRSKSPELSSNPPNPTAKQIEITMIEDIINPPGRFDRPPRIVIILRGPPGSGKTFLAKQIKDKEVENGGSAPRILSLDDYFLIEQERKILEDGKTQIVKEMVYEYEAEMEESYRQSFLKSFKKTITDGYFPFIIVDNVNDKVKHFGEMWSFAKQNGFQVYVCQMDLDPVQCTKRNIHNRSESEIEDIISGWEPTPAHHPTIDASGLLQMCAIADVEMELEEQDQNDAISEEIADPEDQVRSKWDNFDCSSNNLAKLDGVYKPLRKSRTMEEYLQLEKEWEPPKPTQPGKKRVRWADLEEQRNVEKMRAIGFVVGQTDWERMMDPKGASTRALTQTKYIDKIYRRYDQR